MATIFGLHVIGEQMQEIARKLLKAHLIAIGLGLVMGIVETIEHFMIESAVSDLHDNTGADAEMNNANDGFTAFLNVAFPLFCPIGVFFAARSSIQTNNQSMLQGICFIDGCCVFCTGYTTVVGVYHFFWLRGFRSFVQEYDCSNYDPRGSTDNKFEDCQASKEHVENILPLVATFALLGAVVACCQLITCSVGTWQANSAVQALIQQQVFCPPVVSIGQSIGNFPVQPGTTIVVGQPVMGNAMQIGNPVGMVPGTPSLQAPPPKGAS